MMCWFLSCWLSSSTAQLLFLHLPLGIVNLRNHISCHLHCPRHHHYILSADNFYLYCIPDATQWPKCLCFLLVVISVWNRNSQENNNSVFYLHFFFLKVHFVDTCLHSPLDCILKKESWNDPWFEKIASWFLNRVKKPNFGTSFIELSARIYNILKKPPPHFFSDYIFQSKI